MTTTGAAAPAPRFLATLTGRLRKAGFAGEWVEVTATRGALDLAGQLTGRLTLRPGDIENMRVGFEESKYGKHYEWRLWLRDADQKPISLAPIQRGRPEYGDTVRAFARVMADAGALDRVVGGGSKFAALLPPTLFGLLFLAASLISLLAMENEPWWGRLIPPVAPGLLLGYFGYMAVTRHWPRPITRIEDLDRQVK